MRTLSPHTRVLLVSSAEVYGPVEADRLPVREDFPFAPPVSIFAAGKAALELAAHPLIKIYGLHVVIARPFQSHRTAAARRFSSVRHFAEQIGAKVEIGAEPVIQRLAT